MYGSQVLSVFGLGSFPRVLDIFHRREAAVFPGAIVKDGTPCMCSYILKWTLVIRNEGSTLPGSLYSLFLCGSHPFGTSSRHTRSTYEIFPTLLPRCEAGHSTQRLYRHWPRTIFCETCEECDQATRLASISPCGTSQLASIRTGILNFDCPSLTKAELGVLWKIARVSNQP